MLATAGASSDDKGNGTSSEQTSASERDIKRQLEETPFAKVWIAT